MMNHSITIKSIVRVKDGQILIKLDIGDINESITVSYSECLEPYSTIDRIDAVVMGLMFFALRNGYDFKSDIPISAELMYNLDNHFIDALAKNKGFHRVRIDAPVIGTPEKKGSIVATGLSCGVDSLYTIMKHSNHYSENVRLTHATFFDVGSHNEANDERTRYICEGRRALCRKFASEYSIPLLEISSDIYKLIDRHEPLGYQHIEHDTYMMAFLILLFQSGFRTYLCSSSNTYDNFRCIKNPKKTYFGCDNYDLLTLTVASVNGLSFISSGGSTLRVEKVRELCDYPPAWKYLNVCINDVQNDSSCGKCTRTLAAIDAFGSLDRFKDVFDVEYYKRNRRSIIYNLYIEGRFKHWLIVSELFPYLKDDLKTADKIKAVLYHVTGLFPRAWRKVKRALRG